jgi:hypothetical protein
LDPLRLVSTDVPRLVVLDASTGKIAKSTKCLTAAFD